MQLNFTVLVIIMANLSFASSSWIRCLDNSNYTNDITYQANLNMLFSNLALNVNDTGFYSTSVGQVPDRVNAIVLCRGDIQLDTCRRCVQSATAQLLLACPNFRRAFFWEDDEICLLRYSNESIYGTSNVQLSRNRRNSRHFTSPNEFTADLRTLLDSLRSVASSGGPLRKVAAGNTSTADFQVIYAMVQCSPDLNLRQCVSCLVNASLQLSTCCDMSLGARTITPTCHLRYEPYHFYNETRLQEFLPIITTQQHPSQQGASHGNATRTIIIVVIIIVSVVVSLITLLVVDYIIRKRIKQTPTEDTNDISVIESLHYDFGDIRAATGEFSEENKLGEGGFGAVYRGKLQNGQEIAVKRLSINSGQGDLEFKNEVMLLAKLQHRNLVRLFGFSFEGVEKLLVYEFVQNASLDHFLFDPTKRSRLDWSIRYKIIRGIAKGILYLHEDSRLTIIHRDLKAGNVLLDEDMNPKISDFGMARSFLPNETHVSTNRIVGTFGYMAPEYAMQGQFSTKSDVFSFGVLLLQIISGHRIHYGTTEDLISIAWENWRQGAAENLIDPVLRSRSNIPQEILKCIHISLLCIQHKVSDRPSMASVVTMFSSTSMTLPLPVEPVFYTYEVYDTESSQLQDINLRAENSIRSGENYEGAKSGDTISQNDMSFSEFYAR